MEALGGWRLRASGGLTRRANSVWPAPGAGDDALFGAALAARIARVERFYAERRLAPRVQLFPGVAPAALDAELERRGWTEEAPVSVQVAPARAVASAAPGAGFEAALSPEPTPAWWSIAGERSRFADAQGDFRALLERLAGRAVYALVREGGEPAATGLGVFDDGWLGVFAMLTLPDRRGRGAGRAVLAALAGVGPGRGAEQLYLQVERGNAPALALYERAGFHERHGYHYRTHPAGAGRRWPQLSLRHRLRQTGASRERSADAAMR